MAENGFKTRYGHHSKFLNGGCLQKPGEFALEFSANFWACGWSSAATPPGNRAPRLRGTLSCVQDAMGKANLLLPLAYTLCPEWRPVKDGSGRYPPLEISE